MAVLRPTATTLWSRARAAMIEGARKFFRGFLHVAFLLAIAVAGTGRRALGWTSSFLVGQLVGWSVAASTGVSLPAPSGELALGIATALVAAAAWGRSAGRTVPLLVFVAGVLHAAGAEGGLPAVVGQDAILLAGVGLVALLVRRPRRSLRVRAAVATLAGAGSLALVILWVAASPRAEHWDPHLAPAGSGPVEPLPGAADVARAAPPLTPSSAPPVPDLPQQAFLVIEPYAVRLELLLRGRDLPEAAGRVAFAVADQGTLKRRLSDRLSRQLKLRIDGVDLPSVSQRVDFVALGPRGILPRTNAQPEPIADAWIGLAWEFEAPGMPQQVTLGWEGEGALPVTVTDPERSAPANFEQPLIWENRLVADPRPRVVAVPVQPRTLAFPVLAIPCLAFALFGRRGGHLRVRVLLALALLVAPVVEWHAPLPFAGGSSLSPERAEHVTRQLLSNTYRAFEFKREEAVYDRLATSVSGDQLAQVYLEQRRALEMEERGGARARIETVAMETLRDLRPIDGGFEAECVWTVAGSVSHFGHRHYRQNRYVARLRIVLDGAVWKIAAFEVLDETRVL